MAVWLVVLITLAGCAAAPEPASASAIPTASPPPTQGSVLALTPELHVHGLGEDVWRVEHRQPWSANALLVRLDEQTLVLCDTPNDESATGRLLDWIDAAFPDATLHAVVSHYHVDAAGGLATLRERGAETYAGSLTARLLVERGADMGARLAANTSYDADVRARFAAIRWVASEHVLLGDRRALPLPAEPVIVLHPGAAHAPDNVVTWFPERGLLFGGCMVKASNSLGELTDADTERWPEALGVLIDLQPSLVVPGHGAPGDAGLLTHTLDLLASHAPARTPAAPGVKP